MKKSDCYTVLVLMVATAIGTYSVFEKMLGSSSFQNGQNGQNGQQAQVQPHIQTQQVQANLIPQKPSAKKLKTVAAKPHHEIAQQLSSRLETKVEPQIDANLDTDTNTSTELNEIASNANPPVFPSQPLLTKSVELAVDLFSLDMKVLPTQDVASISLEANELPYNDYNRHSKRSRVHSQQ